VPGRVALRQMAIAGLGTLGLCLLLAWLLGPDGGRPPVPQLSGVDARYPVTQLAVAMAVALTGLPFLSRPMHRIVSIALAVAAFSAILGGYGLAFHGGFSLAVGWGGGGPGRFMHGLAVGGVLCRGGGRRWRRPAAWGLRCGRGLPSGRRCGGCRPSPGRTIRAAASSSPCSGGMPPTPSG